jgi:hypothetical protein
MNTSRIFRAIDETESMLARAMRYSPEFRDAALIDFCNAHLAKLWKMVTENSTAKNWQPE